MQAVTAALQRRTSQPEPPQSEVFVFVGHFGLALAAKRSAPRVSLGWLFVAAQLADLLWPLFLLAGWERVRIDPGNTAVTPLAFDYYPISHSLLADLALGAALALPYSFVRRDFRGAAVLFLLVPSHWLLDWVTHRPDLPLTPWTDGKYGLGLWNSVSATIVVETALFLTGAIIYLRVTRAIRGPGRWGLAALLLVLAAIQVANILGPPPPNVSAIAIAGIALWLFPLWGGWVDRSRTPADSAG